MLSVKNLTANVKVWVGATVIGIGLIAGITVITNGQAGRVSAAPANFVYRDGKTLMLNGAPYKFVGFNAYGMTGCETGTPWSQAQIDAYFKSLPPASMTRIWAFQQRSSNLDLVVARAEAHGQKLVMTLGNGLKNCEYPSFDNEDTSAASKSKGTAWFQSTYKGAWMTWVNSAVAKYKNSPAVGLWEVSNEAGHPGNISAAIMKPYFDTVAAAIKAGDAQHLVGTGALAPYTYGGEAGYQQIHSSSNIDVVSFHEYDGGTLSNHFPSAIKVANALNKPLIIGETGTRYDAMLSGQARADYLKKRFDGYLAGGAAGVLIWNRSIQDNNGWNITPGDAAATMVASYKVPGAATTPSPTTPPTTPPPAPVGCTIPTTYGTATSTITVASAGTYTIWSRIMAPDAANNSYALEIDGKTCLTVGDNAAMPANTWSWVNYKDGTPNLPIKVTLASGNHSLKLIGREAGVKVDRVMALSDGACVPNGTGNNCTTNTDAIAPVVSITAPANGSTAQGTVGVNANATDNIAVTKVEFYVNNTLVATDTASPYAYQWNTTGLANSNHTVTVKAYDAAGNITPATTSVKVANGDTQAPTTPTNLKALAGGPTSVTITWTASTDNTGVTGYLLTRNGAVLATVTGTSYVDATAAPDTQYSYHITAHDATGNKSTVSAAASVRTPAAPVRDTQAPTTPTGLTAAAVSTSQINLTWTASTDAVGVTAYDIYRAPAGGQSAKVASVSNLRFGDTGLKPGAYYTYYVVAKDAAGNLSPLSERASATTLKETAAKGTLRGTVKGRQGKVLKGATVTMWSSEGKQYNASTNASGVYRFDNLPAGRYWATFHANLHRDQGVTIQIKTDQTVIKNIQLTSSSRIYWWQWWR